MKQKLCNRCGQTKKVCEFYVRRRGMAAGTPLAHCKRCSKAAAVDYARRRRLGLPLKGRTTLVGTTRKRCWLCKKAKALSSFCRYRSGTSKGKFSPMCRPCAREYGRRWRARTPESGWKAVMRRRHSLRMKYGITLEHYEALKQRQRGLCLICRKRRPLRVDHDHSDGRVRGLLCITCNAHLGWLEVYGDRARWYLGTRMRWVRGNAL